MVYLGVGYSLLSIVFRSMVSQLVHTCDLYTNLLRRTYSRV
jgi:hypothetical protein